MLFIISVILAYLYASFLEWWVHKYILHGLGKKKNNWFDFHWYSHHQKCRKCGNKDNSYLKNKPFHHSVKKELIGLATLLALHFPLFYVSLPFYFTLVICAGRYFYMHRKSHVNVAWGLKTMPWHWKHHMGRNQDANWGITTNLWDKILKTNK